MQRSYNYLLGAYSCLYQMDILTFKNVVENVSIFIDDLGVAIIVAGLVIASFRYLLVGINVLDGYKRYRQDLGRGGAARIRFSCGGRYYY